MDKILAFSILSSSPADISAPGFSTRLSWRASAGTLKQNQQQADKKPRQQDKAAEQQADKKPRQQDKAAEQQASRPAAERKARFAPEFDGINCFESIVSF